jgi:16S rRNA (cytosine1402-N4)-methyltransferase
MSKHIPVLPEEVIKQLKPLKNQNFIDATVGFGGHAAKILAKTGPEGKLLAIDQDPIALEEAKSNLEKFSERVSYANVNFSELGLIVRQWPVGEIDGILFDLGVSSFQLDSAERGFSFTKDGPLDMRMSPKISKSAEDIINKASFAEIRKIIGEYGEEPLAGKIASEIVRARAKKPIKSTSELVGVIAKAIPERFKNGRIHFATKTFQGLRIAVNDELGALENGLKQAKQILSPGGRIVVISFHSLEDRIVKRFFESNMEVLTSKPVMASAEEANLNPRSRSAKLRAAIKIS